jgi:hypothetical protein
MDDAYERGGAVERHWGPLAVHPMFLQAIYAEAECGAPHTSLKEFAVTKGEHPLRGEAGGVEQRNADMGDWAADHDV